VKQLQGRVAVITGGASGIGRSTAARLAAEGCHLALVDINEQRLAETAAALERTGTPVSQHVTDVADADQMQALPAAVRARHGAVHILVNNAGVSVAKSLREHTLDDLRWLVGINFWGVVHGCKFFLEDLLEAEEAHIVNVSSMFGFVGVPGQSSYCATKFAVRGFTESLWAELRETRVGVTSVHPGGIATGIAETLRVTEEAARTRLQETFDRYGHPPEQVAEAVLRGIRKRRLRVIVGGEAYAADWLKRLFPVSTHRWLAHRMAPDGIGPKLTNASESP